MPVLFAEDMATLTGVVSVDDAEPLTNWLRATPAPRVSLASCTHLHTAALQALLAARPVLAAAPTEPFLARWVATLLPGVPASDPEVNR